MLIAEVIEDQIFANAVDLSRLERSLVQGPIQRLVNDVQQEVDKKLQKFNSLTDFQKQRLLAQKSFLDQTALQNSFNSTGKEIRDTLVDLAKVQAQQAVNEINTALKIPLLSVTTPPQMFKTLVDKTNIEGLPLFNYDKKDGTPGWWKKLGDDTQTRIAQEIRKGILSGATPQQMIQRVRGKQTKGGGFEGGVISATKREAEAITRTAVHKVTNESRRLIYEDNQDILEGVQSIGTLDQRTTETCRAYDGLKWTIPEYQPRGHALPFWAPPRHFRCRSVIVPVVIGIEELDRKAKEKGLKINEEIRASNSGPVAVSRKQETGGDMEAWFSKQSVKAQNEMIGVGKAQIYRDGKASLYQMVNSFGEPLTLQQLRQRVDNQTLLPAPVTTQKTKKFLEDLEIEKILEKQAAQSKKNLKYHNENKDKDWYGKVGGKKKGMTKAEYEAAKELKEIRKGAIGKEEEDPVVRVWGRHFGTPQTLSAVAQMRFIRADGEVKKATAATNRAKAKVQFQKDYDEAMAEYDHLLDIVSKVAKPTHISSLETFYKTGFDAYASHSGKNNKPFLATNGGLKAKEDAKKKALYKKERLEAEDTYLKAKADHAKAIRFAKPIETINNKINALPMGDISKPMPAWAKAQAIDWWDEEIKFYKEQGNKAKLKYGDGKDPKDVAKQNAVIDENKAFVITLETAKADWIKAREIKDNYLLNIKGEQGKQGEYLKMVIRKADTEELKAKAFDAIIELKEKEIAKWQDWDKTKTNFGPAQKGMLYAKIQAGQEVLDSAKAWKANWEKDLAATKAQQSKSSKAKKTLTEAEEAEKKAKQAAYKREYRKRKKAAQDAEKAATLNPSQNPVIPDPNASDDPFVSKKTIIGDNWTKVSGQKGSNDGGVFRDALGNEYYVKFMDVDRINSEIASSMMYEKMGMTTLSPTRGVINGREAILTRYRTDLVDLDRQQFLDPTFHQDQFMGMFHASVWTKNWDFVGLTFDNLRYDPVAKKIVMVDPGGSFQFRAQGGLKNFNRKEAVTEYQTFRNEQLNKQSKAAIDGRLKKDVWDEAKGTEALFRITDKDIEDTLRASGFPESKLSEFKEVLISRRDQIVDKFSLSPEFAETIRKGKSWDQALEKHFPYQAAARKALKTEYKKHKSINPGTLNLEIDHNWNDPGMVSYGNRTQQFGAKTIDEVQESLKKINKALPKKMQFDDEDIKAIEGIARSVMQQASGSASSEGSAFMKMMELKHRAKTDPKVGYHNGTAETEKKLQTRTKLDARNWVATVAGRNESKLAHLFFGNDRTSPEYLNFKRAIGWSSDFKKWLVKNKDKEEQLHTWIGERLEMARALDQNRLRRIHGFNYINVERGHCGNEKKSNWDDSKKTFHFNAATSTSISRFKFNDTAERVTAQAKVSDVHFSFHWGERWMHFFNKGEDEYILASRKYRAKMLRKTGEHFNWEKGVDWNTEDLD